MMCPIAYWSQKTPDAFALPNYTYKDLDELVSSLTAALEHVPNKVISFVADTSFLPIAFFFAAWRSSKTVYPLSHRLPQQGIEKRIELTEALLIEPERLDLSKKSETNTIDPDLIATFIETSSSSKIVCHKFQSHVSAANAAADALGIEATTRYALNLPLFHIAGIALILRTFLKGAMVCFEPEEATHMSLVPTQLWRLIQAPQEFPHLKCLLVGGANTAPYLVEGAKGAQLPLYLTYGMTETSAMIALKRLDEPTKVLSHIDLKIAEDGEILVRGPSLLYKYFGQEVHDGWFHTKDIGSLETGLTIHGRKDRQFISGGENIQPEEIEQALLSLPGIVQAKVEPSEDAEFGQMPSAFIYATTPQSVIDIQNHLRQILPRYKIPKSITISLEPLHHTKMAQMDRDLIRDRN